ncbi:MAG: hypothetical protein RLZZ28_1767 [Bacteroidota bacterium]|jgi:endonuclease/exonuclease/phosphatase family metal-dependent hydrolase
MAKNVFRRFTKSALIVINILIALLFWIACLSPYINPAHWWMNGFIGLIVPYLILVLLFFLLFWLMAKPRMAWIPLLALAAGWQQINVVFAWHAGAGFARKKQDTAVRIIDWNVRSLNGISKNRDITKLIPNEIASSILKMHPDIICLQEFNNASGADNIRLFSKEFKYHYFSRDYQRLNGTYQSGCIIFSKLPIIDSGKLNFPVAESLIYADVLKGADTIRIFTTHLQSFKFKKSDYDDIEKIRDQDEESLSASRSVMRKMKLAFSRRGIQANMVREELNKSPYPFIICGDFNDVPNSYTYFHIKGNSQDAFLKKGFAIGRTYIALAPTLRIDYILPSPEFEVKQFDMIDEDLSDHIMLVTDLILKK